MRFREYGLTRWCPGLPGVLPITFLTCNFIKWYCLKCSVHILNGPSTRSFNYLGITRRISQIWDKMSHISYFGHMNRKLFKIFSGCALPNRIFEHNSEHIKRVNKVLENIFFLFIGNKTCVKGISFCVTKMTFKQKNLGVLVFITTLINYNF